MKIQHLISTLVALSFLCIVNSAQAETKKNGANADAAGLTGEQKATLKKWQKYVNDKNASYAKYPIDMCGQEMPITLDASLVAPFTTAQANAELYCEEVRTKLSTMCRNSAELKNDNKEKIKKLVKKISCKAGTKEDEISFNAKNGELQVTMGPKASNISEEVVKYIDSL